MVWLNTCKHKPFLKELCIDVVVKTVFLAILIKCMFKLLIKAFALF